jgi:hypothetical protein
LFIAFWKRAQIWGVARWVVVKGEAHAQGTTRRAVATNWPGASALPQEARDEYAERGESENRDKELECGLLTDRLSGHRYLAGCFRLFLHTLAHNLLVHARRLLPEPVLPLPPAELPVGMLAGRLRRQHFNHRRKADPLREGRPCTWRMRLIKVAARIVVTARRVRFLLSGSWPLHHLYRRA